MKLDVYVGPTQVGRLEQVDLASYVFEYHPDVASSKMVSLLMPVSQTRYENRFLHPVFQVSLPEGALRRVIAATLGKAFKLFGDHELLAVSGAHLIGRLKVVPAGQSLLAEGAPPQDISGLLQASGPEMMRHYLDSQARFSGVSGGFPKVLAKSLPTESGIGPGGGTQRQATLRLAHWIVKGDDIDHPYLSLNEFYSMRAAELAGLPVPEMHLSEDGHRLVIKRFDFDSDGSPLGFEDMCAMMALNAEHKFAGSVERIVRIIDTFCSPQHAEQAREQFFTHYITCMALRNGDAHLKNFGLLYSGWNDIRLSPVYDMVSMGVYAPVTQNGDARDEPALSFGGVRRWFDERSARQLALRCQLRSTQQKACTQRVVEGVRAAAQEMEQAMSVHPDFEPMARRMLKLWSCGIQPFDEKASAELARLALSPVTTRSSLKESGLNDLPVDGPISAP